MRLSILILLTFCCGLALADDASAVYYYPTTSHWYQIISVDAGITQSNAATLAASHTVKSSKGYPWTCNDINEAKFVYSIMAAWNESAQGTNIQASWLGIKTISAQYVWIALTRQSQPFYNLTSNSCVTGQYCNFTSTPKQTDTCAYVYLGVSSPSPVGVWSSNNCSGKTQSLVIEYDPDTTCPSGYAFNTADGSCQDINECLNAKACPTGYTCQNTVGSAYCIPPATATPTPIPTIAPTTTKAPTAAATQAPTIAPTLAATIAPTQAPTLAATIAPTQAPTLAPTQAPTLAATQAPTIAATQAPTSAPTAAPQACSPACASGYSCDATTGTCNDIDECAAASGACGTGVCASGYYCQNTPGSWQCKDINECAIPHSCLSGYSCSNTAGAYYCTDIDECATKNPCGADFSCTNTDGSYVCNANNACLTAGCPYGSNCTKTTAGDYACKAWRFYIISVMDGLVIAVNETSTVADPGTALVTAAMVSGTSQLWRFTPDGYLQSVYFDLYVDRATVGNSVMAVLNNKYDIDSELWTYNATALTVEGATDGLVLDVFAARYGTGVPVIVYEEKFAPEYIANQQWNLHFAGLDS